MAEKNMVAPPPQQQKQEVAQPVQKAVVDMVIERVAALKEAGGIALPKDYSAENAIRAAVLMLADVKSRDGRPALEVCTRESIANAFLRMVISGLSPIKRQCSFIVYGNQLQFQREYAGSIALAKRYGMNSIVANAVFEGDEFVFQVDPATGRKSVVKHIQSMESFGSMNVKGAYAIVEMNDGTRFTEVMSMPQIQKAWEQGATKGNSPAHKNFPDQMACKTVINRACKLIINSSDDGDLFEEEPHGDAVGAHVKHVISENANKEMLSIEDNEVGSNEVIEVETGDLLEMQEETESEPVVAAEVSAEVKPQPIPQQAKQAKAPF